MEFPKDPGNALRKLTGGDRLAFIRLGHLFVSTSKESLENMRQSMNSGDCELSMKILHRLKPNVLMFGMQEQHQAIVDLEEHWKLEQISEQDLFSKCMTIVEGLSSELAKFEEYLSGLEGEE